MRHRVFSGARPTGKQHLGNYLGAIRNYVSLQADYDCVYCIVDIHALTTLEDTHEIKHNVYDMALDWLAAGIDPSKSIVFVQSHVPEVTELHTLLSMVTPLGWLLRCTTFKEKVREHPNNVNYGLLGYPVLMTSDIVLYKADTVPVGEDQLPHLEIAREIVRRFNNLFGPTFPEPHAKLTDFPRVLGLDGTQKMSKSAGNSLEIGASEEETRRWVMAMVTDPARIYRRDPGHPEVCNVFSFHRFFDPEKVDAVAEQCRSAQIGCVDCKRTLATSLNESLRELRARRAELAARPELVREVLADGAARARALARPTIQEVKEKMGLI
ncbi:MAG: tryptophan--tRNA ligase [Chloroflexota bacterium]